jgi:hypothetical protein
VIGITTISVAKGKEVSASVRRRAGSARRPVTNNILLGESFFVDNPIPVAGLKAFW